MISSDPSNQEDAKFETIVMKLIDFGLCANPKGKIPIDDNLYTTLKLNKFCTFQTGITKFSSLIFISGGMESTVVIWLSDNYTLIK